MRVRVIAFATASDIVGRGPTEIELPEGSSLGDLQRLLEERFPAIVPLWPRLAIAVGGGLSPPDHPLAEGDEVALLPPVSGGAPPVDDPASRVDLVHTAIDVSAVESAVADPSCGAVLLFLGAVRNHHAGRDVARLTYSGYEPMALANLERIVRELEADGDRLRVSIVHRLGDVPVGEPSVVIAVASPHRAAAYDASRIALERLKKEVPIWKREHYADGEVVWREEEPLGNSAVATEHPT